MRVKVKIIAKEWIYQHKLWQDYVQKNMHRVRRIVSANVVDGIIKKKQFTIYGPDSNTTYYRLY